MARDDTERAERGDVPRRRGPAEGDPAHAPARRRRPARDVPRAAARRRRSGAAPVSGRRTRVPHAWHFGVGEALARSFSFFGRHLPVLCLYAFVIFLPLALYHLYVASEVWNHPKTGYSGRFPFWADFQVRTGWIGRLLEFGLPFVLQATVTLGVFQYLRGGGRVQYGRSFGRGMARLLPVLGVALLVVFLAFALGLVTTLLLVVVLSVVGGGLGALVLLLLALLAVMGVIACVFFVAVQAVVVEDVGPTKAMARSAWLTRGARWKIFGIWFGIFLFSLIVQLVIVRGADDVPSSFAAARTIVLVRVAVAAVSAAFSAVFAAVVYHDLRTAKEGVDIEELIRVFE